MASTIQVRVYDDLKANRKKINLNHDQLLHIVQIVLTWCWCLILTATLFCYNHGEVMNVVTKYDYVEGVCEISKYRGLFPVKYIQKVEKGLFKKVEMACDLVLKGECDKNTTCPIFVALSENCDIENEWKLMDKKYTVTGK